MAAPDPNNPSHRTKAHALRKAIKAGQTLHESDALWLAGYDDAQKKNGGSKHHGRSRSARKVDVHIEEAAEAEGEGSPMAAALGATAAALTTREEGRRLDSLTEKSVAALRQACDVYKDICLSLRDQLQIYQQSQVAMFEAWRNNYLSRVETEAQLVQEQDRGDPAKDLLLMMIARKMGIPIEGVAGAPRRPNGAPPNGVPKP
jgi:hypothetical protein